MSNIAPLHSAEKSRAKAPAAPRISETEQALLGAILRTPEEAMPAALKVLPLDRCVFGHPPHRIIFEAMLELWRETGTVDAALLCQHLHADGRLAEAGGASYISELSGAVPTSANAAHYAREVLDAADRRAAAAAIEKAYKQLRRGDNPLEVLGRLHGVAWNRPAERLTTVCLADIAPESPRWLWPAYLPYGKLVLLDGDPGVGKSSITIELAARVSTGAAFPLNPTPRKPEGVLLLACEDGLADTIRVRHLRKCGAAKAIHAGGGSIAFSAAARVVLTAGEAPDGSGRRVLAVAKSNLSEKPPALFYTLERRGETARVCCGARCPVHRQRPDPCEIYRRARHPAARGRRIPASETSRSPINCPGNLRAGPKGGHRQANFGPSDGGTGYPNPAKQIRKQWAVLLGVAIGCHFPHRLPHLHMATYGKLRNLWRRSRSGAHRTGYTFRACAPSHFNSQVSFVHFPALHAQKLCTAHETGFNRAQKTLIAG